MKKLLCVVLIIFIFLSMIMPGIEAVALVNEYVGFVGPGGVNARSKPSVSGSVIKTLPYGYYAELESIEKISGSGCSAGWYKVSFNNTIGYVCSTYMDIVNRPASIDVEPTTEYEKVLKEAGFPSSYWAKLSALHEAHPSWIFKAFDTRLKYSAVIEEETSSTKSLYQVTNSRPNYGYLSTRDGDYDYLNDKFIPKDGSSWFNANQKTVSYYMDPRNFLDEKHIFMFESLSYDAAYQTKEAVGAVFSSGSYLNSYIDTFMEAGIKHNINPVYLASRVRQETGLNGGPATNGSPFTYNGKTYSGIYNLFNIGAYAGTNPVVRGLYWAAGGSNGSTSYNRPWTSVEKSILGGSEYLANQYVGTGQYTPYLQKFNVNPFSSSGAYAHQYMQNIEAPSSEAVSVYNSYKKMDFLEAKFVFEIPVFYEMPDSCELPNPENPNNHLKSLSINGALVSGFSHDKYEYSVAVNEASKTVSVDAKAIRSDAVVTGVGSISLAGDKSQIVVSVTAPNKEVLEYKINIEKTSGGTLSAEDVVAQSSFKTDGTYLHGIAFGSSVTTLKTVFAKISDVATVSVKDHNGTVKFDSAIIGTGDTITVTNGLSTKSYVALLYGDNDGDGKVSIMDLLKIQKHILGYSKLDGAYLKASDIDKDGKISIMDLLKIQKHILGLSEITQ